MIVNSLFPMGSQYEYTDNDGDIRKCGRNQ